MILTRCIIVIELPFTHFPRCLTLLSASRSVTLRRVMAELPAVLAVSDGCWGRLLMAVRLVIIELSGGSVLEAWADGSLSVGPRLGDKCGRGLGRDFQGAEIRFVSF